MNKLKKVLIVVLFILIIPTLVFAHPGRTDRNGGHWDHSTGTYHYHNDGSSSSSGKYTFSNSSNVDDDTDETTEELNSKINSLETQLKEKENIIGNLFDSSNEKDKKIDELEAKISDMWFWFFIIVIASMIIFYNIGFKASDNINRNKTGENK